MPPHILAQINEFRAANQKDQVASNRPQGSLTINDVRADKCLQQQVESGLSVIREKIPALAAAPIATTNYRNTKVSDQQKHHYTSTQQGQDNVTDIYMRIPVFPDNR